MKTHSFQVAGVMLASLASLAIVAAAEQATEPHHRSFGKESPFRAEDLPVGRLKSGIQSLGPQAREHAIDWLHSFSFGELDAAESLRVDQSGGVFIVCPALSAATGSQPMEMKSISDPSLGKTSVPVSTPPVYHSKPGATRLIYLDFNGAVVSGKAWKSGARMDCYAWSSDSDFTTFNDSEQAEIRRMWGRISEDYAPFDVDVTTDVAYDPDNYSGDKNKVGWLLFTATTDKNGVQCPHYGSGGVAYVGVYGDSNYFSRYQPAWVTPMSSANMAEAGSHEMGHNMGLSHDGTSTKTYYGGHGATASSPSWGPIMGTGYGRDVSQWSKGEYYDSNQKQDDLAIISARVPYRADDHGNSFVASTLWSPDSVTISQTGVIETTGDADYFTFTTGAGNISFSAAGYKCDTGTWGGNLDIQLELYDSAKKLIASSNPAADVKASISMTVASGQYYLVLKPSGAGTPLANPPSGYTSYASIGTYTITGSVLPANSIFLTTPNGGEVWYTGSKHDITWISGMGGNVKIELLKSSVSYSTIVTSTPNNGSYSWTVPANQVVGTDYEVRITSVESPAKSDVSQADFTIALPPTLADALDTTGIAWSTSGNASWFPQSATSHDGVDAAQSGVIGNGGISSFQATLAGPGTLTFWWKVSSEANADFLLFRLNGVEQTGSLAKISGNVNWVKKTVSIPAGSNTVMWTYAKNSTLSSGSDSAWVDQVVYTLLPVPKIRVEQPVGANIPNSSSKDFGAANVGSNNSLTFIVGNSGDSDLTDLTITKDGTNASEFVVTAKPVSPVVPGDSTAFTVQFVPLAAGARTAVLHISNNDPYANPFDITLTGTGVAPEITVKQPMGSDVPDEGSRDYGNVGVGSSANLTFTIINSGNSDLADLAITSDGINASDFVVTSSPVSPVTAGSSTTFTVRFSPGATGRRVASVHIASNDSDENPYDILLSGTGLAPEIEVKTALGADVVDGSSVLDFGSVFVETANTRTLTIKNSGTEDLGSLVVGLDGPDNAGFSFTQPLEPVLKPGAKTTFTVTCKPMVSGSLNAAIHILSNDSDENPFDIPLAGIGIAPEIDIKNSNGGSLADGSSTLGFRSVMVGATLTKTLVILNSGTAALRNLVIRQNGLNSRNFAVTQPLLTTLNPGASTTFTVTFAPSFTGMLVATIHVSSNDSDENPFDIKLSGVGIAPEIAVKNPNGSELKDGVSTVGFGSQTVSTMVNKTFTIENSGKAVLKNLKIRKDGANAGNFTVTQPLLASLKPGASTTFTVTFEPSVIGARVAALHIVSNDSDENPFDIALKGTGIAPEITVTSSSGGNLKDGVSTVALGSVLVDSRVTRTFTIGNSGNVLLKSLKIRKDGVNSGSFGVTQPLQANLKPGATTTFTVTFKPGAAGTRVAALHIASNDSNENPFDIALTGTGIAPEIQVKGPQGVDLKDGSSLVDFGSLKVKSPMIKTFMIVNFGKAWLKNLKITKDGVDSANFSITQPLFKGLGPGASTTFTITFKPSVAGKRLAAIHIASNDSNENPFDISLTGTGLAKSASPPVGFAAILGLDTLDVSPVVSLKWERLDPTTSVEWENGRKYLALEIRKPAGGLKSGHHVEVSANLLDWYSGRNHTTVLQDDAEFLKVRDNTPLMPGIKRFIRLK